MPGWIRRELFQSDCCGDRRCERAKGGPPLTPEVQNRHPCSLNSFSESSWIQTYPRLAQQFMSKTWMVRENRYGIICVYGQRIICAHTILYIAWLGFQSFIILHLSLLTSLPGPWALSSLDPRSLKSNSQAPKFIDINNFM